MAIFTGTNGTDFITPTTVSDSVTVDPPGAKPSAANDVLYGKGDADFLDGGGGDDSIFGGTGDDALNRG